MKTVLQILCEARAKIAEPGTWTQGAMARNAEHQGCYPESPDAVCFCMMGAVCAVDDCPPDSVSCGPAASTALTRLSDVLFTRTRNGAMTRFNDAYGRARYEVLEVYDHAIRNEVQAPTMVQS